LNVGINEAWEIVVRNDAGDVGGGTIAVDNIGATDGIVVAVLFPFSSRNVLHLPRSLSLSFDSSLSFIGRNNNNNITLTSFAVDDAISDLEDVPRLEMVKFHSILKSFVTAASSPAG